MNDHITGIARIAKYILSWQWTKVFLYWIIVSAGVASECIFLIISLWMSLNASVHPFILSLGISEAMTVTLTGLANTSYVGLPECILPLAVVTVIGHFRMAYIQKHKLSWVWFVLFASPTMLFLGITFFTIGTTIGIEASYTGKQLTHALAAFTLPVLMQQTRGLAGWAYGFIALLYYYVAKPQEADRLAAKDAALETLRTEKDTLIAELTCKNDDTLARIRKDHETSVAAMQKEVQSLTDNLAKLNTELSETKTVNKHLLTTVYQSDETALQAYSQECQEWVKSIDKTASTADVNRYTGHSKRKIDTAIKHGILKVAGRNTSMVLKASLIEWLKSTPPTADRTEGSLPAIHLVEKERAV